MIFKTVSALAFLSVALANPQYYGPPASSAYSSAASPSSSASAASSSASSSSSQQILVRRPTSYCSFRQLTLVHLLGSSRTDRLYFHTFSHHSIRRHFDHFRVPNVCHVVSLCSSFDIDQRRLSTVQHSVTESSFNDPCTPLANGFDSGFVVGGATYSINVTDDSNRK